MPSLSASRRRPPSPFQSLMFLRRAGVPGLPAGVPRPDLLLDHKRGRYSAARIAEGQSYDRLLPFIQVLTRAGSGTFFDAAGILQTAGTNVSRFQHDPVSLSRRGLLQEAPTTNLLFPCRNVTGAGWAASGLTRTASAATGIDGVANSASIVVEDTANVQRSLSATVASGYVTGTQYVFSAIVKRRGPATRNLCMVLSGAVYGTLGTIIFNMTAKTVHSQSGAVNLQAGIIDLGNGWLRPWVSFQAQATASGFVRFDLLSALTAYTAYLGDGASGVDVDFWQVEAGFRPTSPIATTTAAVTRERDSSTISLTGAPWWNAAGGTMLMVMHGIPQDNQNRVLGGVGAVAFDANALYPVKATDNSLTVGAGTGGGVFIPVLTAGGYTGQDLRLIMRWLAPSGAASACLNGGAVITDGTTTLGNAPTQMRVGGSPWGSSADGNNGVSVTGAYWGSQLTDAQMQAATLTEW